MEINLHIPVLTYDGEQSERPNYKYSEEHNNYIIVSMSKQTSGSLIRSALNIKPGEKKITLEELSKTAKLLQNVNNCYNNREKPLLKIEATEAVMIQNALLQAVQEGSISIFEFSQLEPLVKG